jgi:hypothetical protein
MLYKQTHFLLQLTTCMQEAIVTSNELLHVAGTGTACRASLAVYRTGNGWIAYFPSHSNALSAEVRTWGGAVPLMKEIAASFPQLEAHAAFHACPDDVVSVPAKSTTCAIAGAVAGGGARTATAAAPVDTWPLPPGRMAEADQARGPPPKRLRIDVGWSLWSADAEGSDLQCQVRRLPQSFCSYIYFFVPVDWYSCLIRLLHHTQGHPACSAARRNMLPSNHPSARVETSSCSPEYPLAVPACLWVSPTQDQPFPTHFPSRLANVFAICEATLCTDVTHIMCNMMCCCHGVQPAGLPLQST